MAFQRSFAEIGSPLAGVTFCVIDVETTGASPAQCGITEIGAVKVRCGETVGTFQTLVDPGEPVPAFIRLLTGISDEMLTSAPSIEAVLPSLLEFVRGTVLVAHNARFDVGFINAALARCAYPRLTNPVVDTAVLARKILAGEVVNNRLETLARHLRCAHAPCHRAFQDVLATTDVLHHLIERVAGFGVTTLEDLVAVSRSRLDGTFSKITMADALPRAPGVYRFTGHAGRTLYVGVATDLRARVRSYFYGDGRRRIRDLLREAQGVTFELYATGLEARAAEARAIALEQPPYNRSGKRPGAWYLKVALSPKGAKVATARIPKDDGAAYLGPVSARSARALVDALRDSLPIHRCAEPRRCRGCAFSEMKTCSGVDRTRHAAGVEAALVGITSDGTVVLDPLVARMRRLAAQQRFEEAIEARERGALLERVLVREAAVRALVDAGDLCVAAGDRVILVRRGRIAGACDSDPEERKSAAAGLRAEAPPLEHAPLDAAGHAEARAVNAWLSAHATEVDLVVASGGWALPAWARPPGRFAPRPP